MKEGWKYKKLGEVFETYAGGTPSKTNKANYENGTIPWIRSGEVCRKYITESELFISEEGLKSSSAKYYPVNTVLVAMYGATAAQCGILRFEATSNQAVCGILPHKDFLPEFVYSFFTYFKDELASQAQGGAQPNISQEKIKKILFPCISLSEQQRIVSRLDAAFVHIDELKANAEKQLSEARALFQKALTKAMEPKEGWATMKLGEFAYMKAGDFVKASEIFSEYKDGLYPCYGGNGFRGYVREPNQDGDYCLIGRQGALCGCINRAKGIFRTTEHAVIVKPYDDIPTSLVYYMLISLNLNKYSTGAAQPGLSVKNIAEQVIINVPSKDEYNKIASRLDSLSAHVRELEEVTQKTIAECDALKQALLRQVFE